VGFEEGPEGGVEGEVEVGEGGEGGEGFEGFEGFGEEGGGGGRMGVGRGVGRGVGHGSCCFVVVVIFSVRMGVVGMVVYSMWCWVVASGWRVSDRGFMFLRLASY
jgi:hypothetical protein